MSTKRRVMFVLLACGALALLFAAGADAYAQCAMCKTAVSGSPEAAKLAKSLNFAVLVLLVPPVSIFCGVFIIAFRRRRAREDEETKGDSKAGSPD